MHEKETDHELEKRVLAMVESAQEAIHRMEQTAQAFERLITANILLLGANDVQFLAGDIGTKDTPSAPCASTPAGSLPGGDSPHGDATPRQRAPSGGAPPVSGASNSEALLVAYQKWLFRRLALRSHPDKTQGRRALYQQAVGAKASEDTLQLMVLAHTEDIPLQISKHLSADCLNPLQRACHAKQLRARCAEQKLCGLLTWLQQRTTRTCHERDKERK
jgi:hypothetical protein